MACYSVRLENGDLVRLQADRRPSAAVARALADLLKAAHARLSAQQRADPERAGHQARELERTRRGAQARARAAVVDKSPPRPL